MSDKSKLYLLNHLLTQKLKCMGEGNFKRPNKWKSILIREEIIAKI